MSVEKEQLNIMYKVFIVFGTRPEAIKMAPLVLELQKDQKIETIVCVTGQHREMLEQVLETFNIQPNYNLDIMKNKQSLTDITAKILRGIDSVLDDEKPDLVLVHGDTSTTFATALASFYKEIPVAHIEAGLRTHNMRSPYPEEFNRQAVGLFADYHFAATKEAAANLIAEGKSEEDIYITGNTVIDALKTTVNQNYQHPEIEWAKGSRLILVTAHRRENMGESLENIARAILKIVEDNKDVKVIYPVHLNPKIRETIEPIIGHHKQIHLINPLEVTDFHNFIDQSYFVMSDSGGIQEEAPSLGKPVLVLRDTTERPEGVAAGTLKLIGTEYEDIVRETQKLLDDEVEYERMSKASNPYGDGRASERIVRTLKEKMLGGKKID